MTLDFTNCRQCPEGTYPNIVGAERPKAETTITGTQRSNSKQILFRGWRRLRMPDGSATPCANNRAIGNFRLVNNAGDCLSRKNYAGVENINQCGNQSRGGIGRMHRGRCRRGRADVNSSGVETFSGNPTYVYDSSNYMRYRKQKAFNQGIGVVSTLEYKDGGSSRCGDISAKAGART